MSWATSQAEELTRQGHEHARRGDRETAARRYLDAIAFDATYGAAYLALGALHEAAGDVQEALRAYAVGLDHVVAFTEGYVARARLYARRGRPAEAASDLEAALALRPDDLVLLSELARAYVAFRALPAALAVIRRMTERAAAEGDVRTLGSARTQLRALTLLVGELDPALAGITGRGPVRQAIARYARGR